VWAAYLYIAFYAVTDHIAGIGNGVVMLRSDAASTSERPEIDWRFDVANDVGGSGTWALALAAVATSVVALRLPNPWPTCCLTPVPRDLPLRLPRSQGPTRDQGSSR
jgi:hypothetical protein